MEEEWKEFHQQKWEILVFSPNDKFRALPKKKTRCYPDKFGKAYSASMIDNKQAEI